MKILQGIQQGSTEWHAERARRFTASEAPAMMGASKYTTRSDLLKQKATGIVPEISEHRQALFDRGHAAEAGARAIVEEMIGEDLFPATAVSDTDDRLLASLDGVTMTEDTIFEAKLWNESLAAQVQSGILDMHYVWQLEQQLLVSGAERAIFVCSDGTHEKFVSMEYRPVPGRREQLLAGWEQFARDLAAYVPPAASSVEKIVAEPVEALPSVSVKVEGSIVIHENFDAFEVAMRDFLDHRLIREPKTDQHFADLERQIKSMKGAEAALDNAEDSWIAQIETVSAKKRRKDMLKALVRDNRLLSEKLLTSEKERRKGEIVAGGVKALADHIAALNVRLGKPYMPQIPADFGGCIKGMKSLASMEDKVSTELARAKIHGNEVADRIQANLAALRELAADHAFLFADTPTLVLKAADDCRATITSRIGEHRSAEERRAAELAEKERARIRAEEEARARATAAREQQEREALERRQREEQEAREAADLRQKNAMAMSEIQGIQQQVVIAQIGRAGVRKGGTIECLRETLTETEGWPITEENFGALTGAAQAQKDKAVAEIRKLLADAELRAQQQAAVPVASQPQQATPVVSHIPPAVTDNVRPMPTRAPAAPSGLPTLKLGDIQQYIVPFGITAAGLRELGIDFADSKGAAKLYYCADLIRMLNVTIPRLQRVLEDLQKAAA